MKQLNIGCLFFIILFSSYYAMGQVNKFSILNIPTPLLKNASLVKREESKVFEVKSINNYSYQIHKVFTILNESAKSELIFYFYTDKFKSLGDVDIETYDITGKSLKKYSKSDFTKQAASEGLVPDGKINYFEIPTNSYPVTVKIDYEIKYKGLLNYPSYEIQSAAESVEQSSFKVIVPIDLDVRYFAKKTSISPTITQNNSTKTYLWQVNNVAAITYESGAVDRNSRYAQILIAPNKFQLDDYEGDMSSWQKFGNWYATLSKEASNLSEESKLFLQNLVATATTDKEKIKILYTYLQSNFRYVSIQLGIGGFKPFDAKFVDKKKYGDCKALSNYMQASLNAVGIKSYQALINAGYNEDSIDPNFPINQFNHVILCIPQPYDSIWLECTSSINDFGILGNFTENKNALLITEDGGKLIKTPTTNAGENRFSSNATIQLNSDGSGKATIYKQLTGDYKQEFMHYLFNQKKDEQKIYLVEELNYVEPYNLTVNATKNGNATINFETEKFYDFSVGKKTFYHPRIYKIWNTILPTAENRTQDYYFEYAFVKSDTTAYILPSGFSLETLPKNKTFEFDFGKFSSTYTFNEQQNKITTTMNLVLTQHKIPATKYASTKQFFDNVMNEYSDKIVLQKL